MIWIGLMIDFTLGTSMNMRPMSEWKSHNKPSSCLPGLPIREYSRNRLDHQRLPYIPTKPIIIGSMPKGFSWE